MVGWSVTRLTEPVARRSRPGGAHVQERVRQRARGVLTLLGLLATLLAACLMPPGALADAPAPHAAPADVVRAPERAIAIPKVPKGFVEKKIGAVTWAYDPSATSLARELSTALPEAWRKVTGELGAEKISPNLTIRIARGPKDMSALAPVGAPPPSYAVGVAYPALGLIILSVVEPNRWLPPDLNSVMVHELSHVALHRATKGQPLPLWFMEGMAVHQAREQNLARIQTLWEASVAGELMPLEALARNFPTTPHAVNLAYAQSADLVRHMLREPDDREALRKVIHRVAAGVAFDRAVLAAYKLDLPYLEREWRQSMRERFHLTPLVLTGSVLWVGIAVLAAFAFVRRRKQHHEKLARWAEEEARHERALAALELQRRTLEREEAARLAELSRETEVPTIEHDGQQYTLH